MNDEENRELVRRVREIGVTPGQDRLRRFGLAVTAAIPVVGGPLEVLLSETIPAAREKRLYDFLQELADRVEEIGDRLKAGLVDDTFVEEVERVFESVMRTGDVEKHRAFAALLANSLTDGRPNAEERLLFLDLLDRARPIHIKVLRVARITTEAPREFYMGSPLSILRTHFAGYSDDLLRLAWGDLYGWGLVTTDVSALAATMTREGAGNLSARLTELGRQFVGFVSAAP